MWIIPSLVKGSPTDTEWGLLKHLVRDSEGIRDKETRSRVKAVKKIWNKEAKEEIFKDIDNEYDDVTEWEATSDMNGFTGMCAKMLIYKELVTKTIEMEKLLMLDDYVEDEQVSTTTTESKRIKTQQQQQLVDEEEE